MKNYQFLFYNHKREEYRVSGYMNLKDANNFLKKNSGFVLLDIRKKKLSSLS